MLYKVGPWIAIIKRIDTHFGAPDTHFGAPLVSDKHANVTQRAAGHGQLRLPQPHVISYPPCIPMGHSFAKVAVVTVFLVRPDPIQGLIFLYGCSQQAYPLQHVLLLCNSRSDEVGQEADKEINGIVDLVRGTWLKGFNAFAMAHEHRFGQRTHIRFR